MRFTMPNVSFLFKFVIALAIVALAVKVLPVGENIKQWLRI